MNICSYCNHQIYPNHENFIIKNLTGFNVHVNGNMFCSKDCFVMKNVLTSRYKVFEYDYIKSNQRSDDFNISSKR